MDSVEDPTPRFPRRTHVALGEGEETIVEWAEWLDGKRRLEDVGGIQDLDVEGNLKSGTSKRNVDELPWPAWHLFDLQPCVGEGHGVERGRSMPLVATRGCPYQCTFCSSPFTWIVSVGRIESSTLSKPAFSQKWAETAVSLRK